ncbi:hypothetical protein CYLTODRAFT_488748 [Cylindrobasidium torrendii FP15055 ss-10]|uniref:Uncharacterized protein n=1 Tax=Cylindrobasidium torrendii FP15055 ss-10 TaxID=1314674 RepID=A0A0D7BHZ6_9AGAR|nr:hypothetical protein CYLTODRAFT_488748 [Cylindrobasidium torrendii FP15055 ss-10]
MSASVLLSHSQPWDNPSIFEHHCRALLRVAELKKGRPAPEAERYEVRFTNMGDEELEYRQAQMEERLHNAGPQGVAVLEVCERFQFNVGELDDIWGQVMHREDWWTHIGALYDSEFEDCWMQLSIDDPRYIFYRELIKEIKTVILVERAEEMLVFWRAHDPSDRRPITTFFPGPYGKEAQQKFEECIKKRKERQKAEIERARIETEVSAARAQERQISIDNFRRGIETTATALKAVRPQLKTRISSASLSVRAAVPSLMARRGSSASIISTNTTSSTRTVRFSESHKGPRKLINTVATAFKRGRPRSNSAPARLEGILRNHTPFVPTFAPVPVIEESVIEPAHIISETAGVQTLAQRADITIAEPAPVSVSAIEPFAVEPIAIVPISVVPVDYTVTEQWSDCEETAEELGVDSLLKADHSFGVSMTDEEYEMESSVFKSDASDNGSEDYQVEETVFEWKFILGFILSISLVFFCLSVFFFIALTVAFFYATHTIECKIKRCLSTSWGSSQAHI